MTFTEVTFMFSLRFEQVPKIQTNFIPFEHKEMVKERKENCQQQTPFIFKGYKLINKSMTNEFHNQFCVFF